MFQAVKASTLVATVLTCCFFAVLTRSVAVLIRSVAVLTRSVAVLTRSVAVSTCRCLSTDHWGLRWYFGFFPYIINLLGRTDM